MKRKFPWIVFVLLIIFILLNLLLWCIEGIDLTAISMKAILEVLVESVFSLIMFGGLIYLFLPALIYFMLSRESNKSNRKGYIMAIVTLTLQVIFSSGTYIMVALICMYGARYWISLYFYLGGAVLTIVAIIYSKVYLKLKVFNRKEA